MYMPGLSDLRLPSPSPRLSRLSRLSVFPSLRLPRLPVFQVREGRDWLPFPLSVRCTAGCPEGQGGGRSQKRKARNRRDSDDTVEAEIRREDTATRHNQVGSEKRGRVRAQGGGGHPKRAVHEYNGRSADHGADLDPDEGRYLDDNGDTLERRVRRQQRPVRDPVYDNPSTDHGADLDPDTDDRRAGGVGPYDPDDNGDPVERRKRRARRRQSKNSKHRVNQRRRTTVSTTASPTPKPVYAIPHRLHFCRQYDEAGYAFSPSRSSPPPKKKTPCELQVYRHREREYITVDPD